MVVAVNKMDLVGYREEVFDAHQRKRTREFASRLELPDLHFIPISALKGDNVVEHEPRHAAGTTARRCMHHLENVHIASDRNLIDFRFPVQYVIRPNLDFRGFCGTIASGHRPKGRRGDGAAVAEDAAASKSIVTFDGELDGGVRAACP